MEPLASCAQLLGEYLAFGFAGIVALISLVAFAIRRSFLSAILGLLATATSFALGYVLFPVVAIAILVGQFGIFVENCYGLR